MRNGFCSKCSSATVYSKAGGVGISDNGQIHVYTGRISKAVPYVSFVCTTCGYFENYIADRDKLADVAKNWAKVASGG